MLFGDPSVFAIECEIIDKIDKWVFADFRFWAVSEPIGDYDDSMDLLGGVYYLKESIKCAEYRHAHVFNDLSKEEIFRIVFDSIMITVPKGESIRSLPLEPDLPYDYDSSLAQSKMRSGCHLDAVGMSSFCDKWNIILVENSNLWQRLIWRNLDTMELKEALFPPNRFEQVAQSFLDWIDLQKLRS
jgi:Immunity protein 42